MEWPITEGDNPVSEMDRTPDGIPKYCRARETWQEIGGTTLQG
jgi:hypothetical protein